ncbi:class F sortase [uncultured Jatrophihabitans sp.]|uniref:class F sortase n=1 Tax=uncultured Jatrophihabitans sp. TaxID=1610747 RepID=UPI0035C9EB92
MAPGGVAAVLNLRNASLRYAAAALVLGGAAAGIAVAASDGSDGSSAAARPAGAASSPAAARVASGLPTSAANGGPALPTLAAGDVGVAAVNAGPQAAARPVRVEIPAIDVDSTLQALALLPDGTLQPPSKWQRAGWYADGVAPGEVGPAVIAGHVDSTAGPAVFFRLTQLRRGERVYVTRRDGRRLAFVIDRVAEFPKRRFPTEYVYGATPDAQLRLVTCTGDFDAAKHSYVDNLVVSAHLA